VTKVLSIARPDAEGYITGANLRPVLSTTNLPMKVLKDIWALADTTKRGSLDKDELKVAMQLIALAQQGRSVSMEELRNSNGFLLHSVSFFRVSLSPHLHLLCYCAGFQMPTFYELDTVSLQPDFGSGYSSSTKSSAKSTAGNSKYPQVHFQELLDRETIKMEAGKEKGGTLIKFTNYVVKSDV